MSGFKDEIIAWLHRQPDWLQEATEKLLSTGACSDDDIAALADRLKTAEGQKVTTHRTFEGLEKADGAAEELRLVSIGKITGIERLAPRNPLTFGKGNLTVIYGHNGSGKSGYTRILKKACGKSGAGELKPNVFATAPTTQQCSIVFSLAQTEHAIDWQATGASIPELNPVDLFDTHVATRYLTGETEVSYTPPQVALFQALAKVCDRISQKLKVEQDKLLSKLPLLPPEYTASGAGASFKALTPKMSDETIQKLTSWDESDDKQLEALIARLKADDPATLARERRKTKVQLEQVASQVETLVSALNPEAIEAFRKARLDAKDKRRVAVEAAKANTASAKLDGIGSDTWIAMWNAARNYSQVAYPGQTFPVTSESSLCVLCHQELVGEAPTRLRDFETFVQGSVERTAQKAEKAYQEKLRDLPVTLTEQEILTRCQAAGLREDRWVVQLSTLWNAANACVQNLRAEEAQNVAIPLPTSNETLQELKVLADHAESEAKKLDEDAKNFDRAKAAREKTELEARRWVAQQKVAVLEEIKRKEKLTAYTKWIATANSGKVSRKASDLAVETITPAYVERFNKELKALGASYLKVEIVKTKTPKGTPLHELRLVGASARPADVLSEGERRIVSLAAFLADVVDKPFAAPFVFDDPISSLDHEFEREVAERLASLSLNRQVIILTHRLSLLGSMEDAALKHGDGWHQKNFSITYIESIQGATGVPSDDEIWNKDTAKANVALLLRLDEAKEFLEAGKIALYRSQAQAICSNFRKLLERTVEEDLLNKVVKRHRRSVTTDKRLGKLQLITKEDCDFIDRLMTKYSAFEHSQSEEVPVRLPDETELREDLEALKTWRAIYKGRSVPLVPA